MTPVPPLLRHLVDDAALFPPGNAPMTGAVAAHRALPSFRHAELVGPFLCPATRLRELQRHLEPTDELPLGLIVDTGLGEIDAAATMAVSDPRVRLHAIEVSLPGRAGAPAEAAAALIAAARWPRVFVEVPWGPDGAGALDVLAEAGAAGRAAKLRTGGLRADLFPTAEALAERIMACVERDLPFKCTAGLHHAVRHDDPATGFSHHGFLNILVATAAALRAEPVEAVAAALAETDAERLTAATNAITAADGGPANFATRTRERFLSYGSCSLTEPAADLEQLGLLAPG